MVSDFAHNSAHGRTPKSLAMDEYLALEKGGLNATRWEVRNSLYSIHLANWLKHFRAEQILVSYTSLVAV